MRPEDISPRHQRYFKVINGVVHKRCTGQAHDEPVWLPATEKYFHVRKARSRNGRLVSRCRLCTNWEKIKSPGSATGLVEAYKVRPFYVEAINRVGLMELARRTQLHYTGITNVLDGKVKYVRKSNLRKVMLELISMQRHGEHSAGVHAKRLQHKRMHRTIETCSGCGTPVSNYTEGCLQCTWRRNNKDRRERLVGGGLSEVG